MVSRFFSRTVFGMGDDTDNQVVLLGDLSNFLNTKTSF
jgi:hypothetical protein